MPISWLVGICDQLEKLRLFGMLKSKRKHSLVPQEDYHHQCAESVVEEVGDEKVAGQHVTRRDHQL